MPAVGAVPTTATLVPTLLKPQRALLKGRDITAESEDLLGGAEGTSLDVLQDVYHDMYNGWLGGKGGEWERKTGAFFFYCKQRNKVV